MKYDTLVTTILEKCWKGFKQQGMKMKGKHLVPNCVKKKKKS